MATGYPGMIVCTAVGIYLLIYQIKTNAECDSDGLTILLFQSISFIAFCPIFIIAVLIDLLPKFKNKGIFYIIVAPYSIVFMTSIILGCRVILLSVSCDYSAYDRIVFMTMFASLAILLKLELALNFRGHIMQTKPHLLFVAGWTMFLSRRYPSHYLREDDYCVEVSIILLSFSCLVALHYIVNLLLMIVHRLHCIRNSIQNRIRYLSSLSVVYRFYLSFFFVTLLALCITGFVFWYAALSCIGAISWTYTMFVIVSFCVLVLNLCLTATSGARRPRITFVQSLIISFHLTLFDEEVTIDEVLQVLEPREVLVQRRETTHESAFVERLTRASAQYAHTAHANHSQREREREELRAQEDQRLQGGTGTGTGTGTGAGAVAGLSIGIDMSRAVVRAGARAKDRETESRSRSRSRSQLRVQSQV